MYLQYSHLIWTKKIKMVPYSLQKPQHPKRVRQDLTFPVDIQSDFSTHFRQVALMLEDDFVIFKPSFNKFLWVSEFCASNFGSPSTSVVEENCAILFCSKTSLDFDSNKTYRFRFSKSNCCSSEELFLPNNCLSLKIKLYYCLKNLYIWCASSV